MWLYCPKCNVQTNAEDKSLYYVYKCKSCGHRFRGILAKQNTNWNAFFRVLTPYGENPDLTCCIHCGANIRKAGTWPSVCSSCGRDLPTKPPAE